MIDANDIANWIAVTALLPLGLFIFYYGTKPVPGKWYRKYSNLFKSTTIGKVLMLQKITWFLFLIFVLHSIFFDYYGQDFVRILVYGALVTQFWVVFATLRRIQKSPSTSTGPTNTQKPPTDEHAIVRADDDPEENTQRLPKIKK